MSEKVLVEINANDNASRTMDHVADKAQGMGSRLDSAFRGAEDASKKFAGVLVGAMAAIGAGLGYGIKFAADIETATQGLVALLGSTEAADKTIERLKVEAARTPFELPGLTQATQLLSSVTKDGDKSIDILLDVGESLAGMGKGQAELDRIIVNLQQIAALGKASTLDIKQFAFAGIPIYDMLAEKTGLAKDALGDFITNGGVTFDLLTEMFAEATDEGGRFFGAFAAQAGTFNQLWSNMKDIIGITLSEIVQSTGIFDAVKNALAGFINFLTSNKDNFIEWINWLKEQKFLLAVVAGVILGALAPSFYVLAGAIGSTLQTLAPFMAIGAALAALAYVIYSAWTENWWGVRDIVTGVIDYLTAKFNEWWPIIVNAFQNIALFVGIYIDLIMMTVGWWIPGMIAVIQGGWDNIWNIIKAALDIIYNTIAFVWNAIVGLIKGFLQLLGGDIKGAWQTWSETTDKMGKNLVNIVLGIWTIIKETIIGALEAVKNFFVGWWDFIFGKIQDLWGWIQNITGAVSSAESERRAASRPGANRTSGASGRFAEGGIVTRPTIALIGEAGPEAVVPLGRPLGSSPLAGGGVTIVIEGNNFYGDDDRLAERIGNQIVEKLSLHMTFPRY